MPINLHDKQELLSQIANMELRDQLEIKEQMIKKLKVQLEIAIKFMKFVERYDCKVITPKDFNKYEAVWFLIRSEAQEKLEQIERIAR